MPASRDQIDIDIVSKVTNEDGTIINYVEEDSGNVACNQAGEYAYTTKPTLAENTNSFVCANPNDDDSDGYTNLEECLHAASSANDQRRFSLLKKLLIILIILTFPTIGLAANSNEYADLDAVSDGVGTFADPFNTVVGKVKAGTNLRLKCGTSETTTSGFLIDDVDGTALNPIIVGAYYDDGGVVHEDDKPTFGTLCGNGDPKPILTETNTTEGQVIKTDVSDYIEFNSVQFKLGETTMLISSSYNTVKFCYFEGGKYAIRIDDGFDNEEPVGTHITRSRFVGDDIQGGDGVQFRYESSAGIVEYCSFDRWEHSSISSSWHTVDGQLGSALLSNRNHIFRYNYIENTSDDNSECIVTAGSGNEVAWNWCEDAGLLHFTGGSNVKIHHNIFNNVVAGLTDHRVINVQDVWEQPITDSYIYNNIIHFDGTQGRGMVGIGIRDAKAGSVIERILIANNIVLNANTRPFDVYDNNDEVESNCNDADCIRWNNNIAYGHSGGNYARVEGTYYANTTLFDAIVDGAYNVTPGNLESDPELANSGTAQFWPNDAADPTIDAGFGVGVDYDDFLASASDFTAFSPSAVTQVDRGSGKVDDNKLLNDVTLNDDAKDDNKLLNDVTLNDDAKDDNKLLNDSTIHEDAEDGTAKGWKIYDNSPQGATIKNVYDNDRQSHVIQFTGYGTENGYRLSNDDGTKWQNASQFVIRWSMKYSENFVIYIEVATTAGQRYLYYTQVDYDALGSGQNIHHGLGDDVIDGRWHTLVTDLQADLDDAQPGEKILEVNGFLIRGSGKVDDIKLLNDVTLYDDAKDDNKLLNDVTLNDDAKDDNKLLNDVTLYDDAKDDNKLLNDSTIHEDAEDGTAKGWKIYDNSPQGATIKNVYDNDRQSHVIQFTGYGTENGYRLSNDDGTKWQNASQFVIRWGMKYSEDFVIYIDAATTAGQRYLYYTRVDYDALGSGKYIHHGLGDDAIDGRWHTFVTDLQADLDDAQPGEQILEVNGFLIRGSGKVDDIILLNQ